MKRKYVVSLVIAVSLVVLYWWLTHRASHVLDAGNSSALDNLFNQENPGLAGVPA